MGDSVLTLYMTISIWTTNYTGGFNGGYEQYACKASSRNTQFLCRCKPLSIECACRRIQYQCTAILILKNGQGFSLCNIVYCNVTPLLPHFQLIACMLLRSSHDYVVNIRAYMSAGLHCLHNSLHAALLSGL